jgi:hypothetical protein
MKRLQYSISLLLIAGSFTSYACIDSSCHDGPPGMVRSGFSAAKLITTNTAMLSDFQRVANIWQVVMPSKSARQPIVSAISNLLQENPYLLQGSLAQVKARSGQDDNLSLLISSSNSAINNALLGTLTYEANTYGAYALRNAASQIEAILSGNNSNTPTAPLANQLVTLWSGYFGDGAANQHFMQLAGTQPAQTDALLSDFQRIYNIWQVVMPAASARAPIVMAVANILHENPAIFAGSLQEVQARAATHDNLQIVTNSSNRAISSSLLSTLNYEANNRLSDMQANVDKIVAILSGSLTVPTAGMLEWGIAKLWTSYFLGGNGTLDSQFGVLAGWR